MNMSLIIRYTILILSAGAMVVGVLVVAGFLVPRHLPDQFRVVMGIVVFLYGAYRFSITFFQRQRDTREP